MERRLAITMINNHAQGTMGPGIAGIGLHNLAEQGPGLVLLCVLELDQAQIIAGHQEIRALRDQVLIEGPHGQVRGCTAAAEVPVESVVGGGGDVVVGEEEVPGQNAATGEERGPKKFRN